MFAASNQGAFDCWTKQHNNHFIARAAIAILLAFYFSERAQLFYRLVKLRFANSLRHGCALSVFNVCFQLQPRDKSQISNNIIFNKNGNFNTAYVKII